VLLSNSCNPNRHHLKAALRHVGSGSSSSTTGHSYIHLTQSNAILRQEPLEDRQNILNAFQTSYTGPRLPTTLQQLLYFAHFCGGSIQPLRFYDDATAAQSPSSNSGTNNDAETNHSGPTYHTRMDYSISSNTVRMQLIK
jgi:hypothetical protein